MQTFVLQRIMENSRIFELEKQSQTKPISDEMTVFGAYCIRQEIALLGLAVEYLAIWIVLLYLGKANGNESDKT